MSGITAWRCRHDHIMGWVRDGDLVLLRNAIDVTAGEPDEVDVMATIEQGSSVMNIKCSVCYAVRSWHPKPKAGARR